MPKVVKLFSFFKISYEYNKNSQRSVIKAYDYRHTGLTNTHTHT